MIPERAAVRIVMATNVMLEALRRFGSVMWIPPSAQGLLLRSHSWHSYSFDSGSNNDAEADLKCNCRPVSFSRRQVIGWYKLSMLPFCTAPGGRNRQASGALRPFDIHVNPCCWF